MSQDPSNSSAQNQKPSSAPQNKTSAVKWDSDILQFVWLLVVSFFGGMIWSGIGPVESLVFVIGLCVWSDTLIIR